MNRKIKIGIIVLLSIIMIGIHVSYAISNQEEGTFFKVNKEEISQEETLEMTFDISSLEYNKFKILLKSNVNSADIYAENEGNISIDSDESAISIDIDKEKIGLNQIKLYYPIPKEMAIGTKLQFTVQIIVNNEIKEENEITNTTQDNAVTNESEIDNNTQSSGNEINQDNTNQEIVAQEITKIITIVEKKAEDNKNNVDNENSAGKEDKEQNEEKNKNQNEKNNDEDDELKISNTVKNNFNQKKTDNQIEKMSVNNISNNTNVGYSLSNSGINNENQATYNGSNNNYLSKLEIEGIELNTSFNKENENYFINTDNTNTINVILEAEDNTAKVNIAGNDTIQNGNNKILISVTAENGDVRYYRIFVNCEEGTDET